MTTEIEIIRDLKITGPEKSVERAIEVIAMIAAAYGLEPVDPDFEVDDGQGTYVVEYDGPREYQVLAPCFVEDVENARADGKIPGDVTVVIMRPGITSSGVRTNLSIVGGMGQGNQGRLEL